MPSLSRLHPFELEIDWNDSRLEARTLLNLELEILNELGESDWIVGGSVKLFFQK